MSTLCRLQFDEIEMFLMIDGLQSRMSEPKDMYLVSRQENQWSISSYCPILVRFNIAPSWSLYIGLPTLSSV